MVSLVTQAIPHFSKITKVFAATELHQDGQVSIVTASMALTCPTLPSGPASGLLCPGEHDLTALQGPAACGAAWHGLYCTQHQEKCEQSAPV